MIGVTCALSVSTGPVEVAVLVDEENSTYLSDGGKKNVPIEPPSVSAAVPCPICAGGLNGVLWHQLDLDAGTADPIQMSA